MKVMLISENPNSMSTISRIFEKLSGNYVVWTCSGQEALDKLKNKMVDLIITNEKFCDITGPEIIKSIIFINPMISCADEVFAALTMF